MADLAILTRRRGHGSHLSDALGGAGALHPRRTPAPRRRSSRRASSSRRCRRSATCCRRSKPSSSWTARRRAAARRSSALDAVARAGPRAAGGRVGRRARVPRPRARGAAGSPRDHHLHVRHDRRAQGRDADARQPGRRTCRPAPTSCSSPKEDVALSFLPLSHAFERMVVLHLPLTGVTVVFAESLDTIGRDIAHGAADDA